jgi:leucyl aminopeptidase
MESPPMLECFAPADAEPAKPVFMVRKSGLQAWLAGQPGRVRAWLEASGFEAKPGRSALIPGADGPPEAALLVLSEPMEPWDSAALQGRLPAGVWRLEPAGDADFDPGQAALGFALASYRFDRYKKREAKQVKLALEEGAGVRRAATVAEAIFLARDLINTPALDLGPAELAEAVQSVAERFDADCRALVGEDLLREGYPAVYAVGQASPRAPRVMDLRWGEAGAPRVTLVGKGVCFDTGGLDIKPSQSMALMKKDMGGAAITLALAQAIMALRLPVRLRLLIGAVENSVAGSSYRPGDVLRTRKGLTVEVGNTDAEGRIVLCDLLADADAERPEIMIDCATLTGAARVALGPDLPALFTPDDDLADTLLAAGRDAFDPLWRLPLFAPYREMIDSPIADINNAGNGSHAGAITAALFLKDFVSETRSWAHLDLFAWNPKDRPGRAKGGEATALRAMLLAIERKFGA